MLTSNGYVLDESPDRLGHLEPVPVGLRADASAMWSRLRADGYLYLDGHLDPELVESFRGYYFSQLAATGLVDPGSPPRRGLDAAGEVDRANLRRILFDEIVPGTATRR